jgi:hypothetical protein
MSPPLFAGPSSAPDAKPTTRRSDQRNGFLPLATSDFGRFAPTAELGSAPKRRHSGSPHLNRSTGPASCSEADVHDGMTTSQRGGLLMSTECPNRDLSMDRAVCMTLARARREGARECEGCRTTLSRKALGLQPVGGDRNPQSQRGKRASTRLRPGLLRRAGH